MGDIHLEFSSRLTSEEIIYDLMDIERDAYSPEYRGEFEPICKRFRKYPEMFILACDGDRVIGYLCFFPITERLHHELLYSEEFHDDDIPPEDVMEMSDENYIYFLSIALYRKYHGRGIGQKLTEAFFRRLRDEERRGHRICDIVASVVTPLGERLLSRNGFRLVSDLSETKHFKLFRTEDIGL